jgi:DNA-binding transcriptional MerR regulator
MNDFEHLYTIQQLSVKLNIPKPTLRFWEKELNGIIIPFRTPGGQRRYSPENVKVIEKIDKLRKNGMKISEIRQKFETFPKEQDSISNSTDIDKLADKVAAVVKHEVYKFLKTGFEKKFLA